MKRTTTQALAPEEPLMIATHAKAVTPSNVTHSIRIKESGRLRHTYKCSDYPTVLPRNEIATTGK